MPNLADRFGDEAEKRRKAVGKPIGVFEVASLIPFMVYMNGSDKAVPAFQVAGLSYTVGMTGMYLHRQGQPPLCIPTA